MRQRAKSQMKPRRFKGDPWPTIQAPLRHRGRPTESESAWRKRLDREHRERLAQGLVTVLAWSHDARLYCTAWCIITNTDLFTKGIDWRLTPWLDSRDEEFDRAAFADLETGGSTAVDTLTRARFTKRKMLGDFDIGPLRNQVLRGRWPLPRYEVRRHYAADVAHMHCHECGKPFRPAMPDTAWTRRLKSQHKRARERARLAQNRRYRQEREQQKCVPSP